MNSKSKNKSFTQSDNLTREELDSYRVSVDGKVKHVIEKKSLEDEFNSDALDGWSESPAGTSSMKSLDKKFTKSSNSNLVKSAVLTASIIVFVFIFNSYSKNKTTSPSSQKTADQKTIVIEKTDVLLPIKIEELKEIPKKDQIHIHTIQKEYQIREEQKNEIPKSEKIHIDQLPLKAVHETEKHSGTVILKNQSFGIEIYLEDLKLIDYRKYRSRPTVTTKQAEIIGTPASQENKAVKEEDLTNWKNVEIPYIEYIDKTIGIFAKGNLKKALSRFEVVLNCYPTDVNANFYGGLCYFNLGEYDKTILTLEKCLQSDFNNFNEEAEWYIAKSYSAKGNLIKAKELFRMIAANGGYYSKQAANY